jgi:hypothetical protein
MSCELRFCGRDGRVLNRRLLRLKPGIDGDCQRHRTPGLGRPSVGIRWRPPLAGAFITHLVSQSLPPTFCFQD